MEGNCFWEGISENRVKRNLNIKEENHIINFSLIEIALFQDALGQSTFKLIV